MCKAPIAGFCKTRLSPPLTAVEAAQLAGCFIADVAATIGGVTADGAVAVYTPAASAAAFVPLLPPRMALLAQRGADLGQRMLAAIEDLLAAGFAGVCLINADSPTLPAALLQRAAAVLRPPGDRLVLGPAIDGGYYLIGVKQAHPQLFSGVAWSTGQVLAQTLVRAASLSLPVSLLPLWYDVDDPAALQLLLQDLAGRHAMEALRQSAGSAAAPLIAGGAAPRTRQMLRALLQGGDAARFALPDPAGIP
jgi:rSAM/selenodomain-associated transferase 1